MFIEYKMTKEFAKSLLNERKGNEKRMSNQAYLCKYVNDVYGLKGKCVRVLITL